MNPLLPTALISTFLGTASFHLQYGDTQILIDPGDLFTGRLTAKKAKTLEHIDIILLTHLDFDHMNRLVCIPHSRDIPILAPTEARKNLCTYQFVNEQEYTLNGIRIQRFKCIHGMRHNTPHIGFVIFAGDKVLCHMGDAYRLVEPLAVKPDYLFISLCGMETGVERALFNISILEPKTVIPMHWEVLFRSDAKAKGFEKALKAKFPLCRCLIPLYDKAMVLE